MKMHWKAVVFLCVLSLTGSLVRPSAGTARGPKLRVPQPEAILGKVVEGVPIHHEFQFHNDGGAPLVISDVKTDCGCTAVDLDRNIPAGEQGRLVAVIDTDGYGGQAVARRITLLTNDPAQPRLVLELRFDVARLFTLTPAFAKLEGPADSRIETRVKVKPEPDYRFRILEARAKSGRYIDVRLEEPADADGAFTVTVTNRRAENGRYFDKVLLKTDSPHRPEITIGVFGNIG